MVISPRSRVLGSSVLVAVLGIVLTMAGCAAPVGGSAVVTASVATVQQPDPVISSAPPSSAPPNSRPSVSQATGSLPAASPEAISTPSAPTAIGGWSAVIEVPPDAGMVSPTGDLLAQFSDEQVCLVPTGQPAACGVMADGSAVTFAAFSQNGEYLLVVAGEPVDAGVYVFRSADASVRILGPDGVTSPTTGAEPPSWNLSSAVWGADGSSILLLPKTGEPTGAVLEFDLTSGTVRDVLRLDAELANSTPSLWTTRAGLAIVPSSGEERNSLWWADSVTGGVVELAEFGEPGGSLLLSAADQAGDIVLACPRLANGDLGATVGVAVDGSQNARVLKDSGSCAGTAFSPDGSYLAMTALVDDDYVLMVADRRDGGTVLTTSRLFPHEPTAPPYLTWVGDAIVVTDVTGDWLTPTIIVRLQR